MKNVCIAQYFSSVSKMFKLIETLLWESFSRGEKMGREAT